MTETTDPQAARSARRDRIAETLMPFFANFSSEDSAKVNAGEAADAVLAVLPEPADDAAIRADAFKAAANYVRGHSADERYGKASISTALCAVSDALRRMADEAQQPTGCDHDSQVIDHEGHQYWACLKCGQNLGKVADEAQQPKTRKACGCGQDGCEYCDVDDDAGEAQQAEAQARSGCAHRGPHPGFTCGEVNASQPYFNVRWDNGQAEAQGALLATRCDACRHALNWHRSDVGCTVALCVCSRFQPPTTMSQPAKGA